MARAGGKEWGGHVKRNRKSNACGGLGGACAPAGRVSPRGWNMYPKFDTLRDVVLVGSGGVSRESGPVHTPV